MDRIDRAIIQSDCQQLLNRVTNLIDNRQWQALVDHYVEDGVLYRPSDPDNGLRSSSRSKPAAAPSGLAFVRYPEAAARLREHMRAQGLDVPPVEWDGPDAETTNR
jgi:hypothetical protein